MPKDQKYLQSYTPNFIPKIVLVHFEYDKLELHYETTCKSFWHQAMNVRDWCQVDINLMLECYQITCMYFSNEPKGRGPNFEIVGMKLGPNWDHVGAMSNH